jgi:hypothetical protein
VPDAGQPSEAKDDATLVLLHDTEGERQQYQHYDYD